jgi:endonuclease/exonuclease/phosphatase (EEP) superfamily protein YafD
LPKLISDDLRWGAGEPMRPPAPKRLRRDWSGALVGLCIGLAGLALTRLGWLRIQLDVFSAFTIQAAILALASFLGLLLPRFKTLAASVLFVLGIVAYGLWPSLQVAADDAVPDGAKRIRIATFNIDDEDGHAAPRLASIERLDADIIVLTEYDGSDADFASGIAKLYPHLLACDQSTGCDVAIASRYPLALQDGYSGIQGPNAVAARLGPDYANLLIVGVHASHVPNSTLQFEELSDLSKRLGAEHGPMIVTGDFNATSQSRLVQDFGKSLDLTQTATLPTFPAYFGLPQLAIDQMMVSSDIVKLGPQTGGSAAGSDHIPIACSFAIPTSR